MGQKWAKIGKIIENHNFEPENYPNERLQLQSEPMYNVITIQVLFCLFIEYK